MFCYNINPRDYWDHWDQPLTCCYPEPPHWRSGASWPGWQSYVMVLAACSPPPWNIKLEERIIKTTLQTAGCALSVLPCLVFLDIVTVLSGASVLGPSSSPTSFDLSAISSIRTLCRVSLSFSLIPSLGLKTPRKRGSSSGVSGSRWAPTMVIFCCDLGQKHGVRWGSHARQ